MWKESWADVHVSNIKYFKFGTQATMQVLRYICLCKRLNGATLVRETRGLFLKGCWNRESRSCRDCLGIFWRFCRQDFCSLLSPENSNPEEPLLKSGAFFMVNHKKCLWCLQWESRSELIRQLLTSSPENTAQWGCYNQEGIFASVRMNFLCFVQYKEKRSSKWSLESSISCFLPLDRYSIITSYNSCE